MASRYIRAYFLSLSLSLFLSLSSCIPDHSQRLDQVLDFEHGGVSRHLGKIADSMNEWEGSVADQLGLVPADVAAIKMENSKLSLQA